MKTIPGIALSLFLLGGSAYAVDSHWTGTITDTMCGKSHAAAEHGKKMTAAECVKVCVKNGAKYAFLSGGKLYTIENQDFADLESHAGHRVTLTGEKTNDSIKVSKIEMPSKAGKRSPSKAKKTT